MEFSPKNFICHKITIFTNEKWRRVFIGIYFSVVVTGSTDGIGKEYAKNLAKHGINIVLIAHIESKLIDVSKEIGKHICLIVSV